MCRKMGYHSSKLRSLKEQVARKGHNHKYSKKASFYMAWQIILPSELLENVLKICAYIRLCGNPLLSDSLPLVYRLNHVYITCWSLSSHTSFFSYNPPSPSTSQVASPSARPSSQPASCHISVILRTTAIVSCMTLTYAIPISASSGWNLAH